jgi:hypothetical protein
MLLALPWTATDLPLPVAAGEPPGGQEAPLLSPAALVELVRFLRQRAQGVAGGALPRRLP